MTILYDILFYEKMSKITKTFHFQCFSHLETLFLIKCFDFRICLDGEEVEEEMVGEEASNSDTPGANRQDRDGKDLKDIKGESVIDELPGEDWRAEAKAFKDKENKKGVIYMASVPPFMKVDKVRSLLSTHGEVLRIFLRPEDQSEARRRKKAGGNKKTKFRDGWIEFADKKIARSTAEALNCQPIGGKKRHWKHDIWNLKYLPKFKWMHLMEFQHYQSQVRKTRLRTQVEQVKKENQYYKEQVDRKKGIDAVKAKKDKKRKLQQQQQQPDSRFSSAKLAEIDSSSSGTAVPSSKRKASSGDGDVVSQKKKKAKNLRSLSWERTLSSYTRWDIDTVTHNNFQFLNQYDIYYALNNYHINIFFLWLIQ